MKRMICFFVILILLNLPVRAAEIPSDLMGSVPSGAEELLEEVTVFDIDGFTDGIHRILMQISRRVRTVLRQQMHGAVSVLFVAVLCGVIDSMEGLGGKQNFLLPMAGALSITILTAGSIDSLIGLGAQTIDDLQLFSKTLLPTLAAATAASGFITTATFQQVTTVFLVDLLLSLIDGLLMPLLYLYIGMLAAAACLPDHRLMAVADGLKSGITWILKTSLLLFTLYISVVRVISGNVDSSSVRIAKAAISGVVPVVGGIIAEASETVLAGAGLLKNTVGVFGMLVILASCAYPFLQLGVQYILYKLTAFLAAVIGLPAMSKLIAGLGGAFGLVLGMTGACALLLLVSVLSCMAAVIP